MDRKTVISVHHLAKQFKNEIAIKDISFAVHQGEIFGFLGPSGAGKTTTIKLLTNQLTMSGGSASILGTPVEKIDESIYEQVGIVSHNSGVYERLSVATNLKFFAKLLNVPNGRIEQVLEEVELSDNAKKIAGKLSQGMRQRLILARAVLHQPKILFLDEPTSGLDPSTSEAIHKMLLKLRDQGTAIFLTTHNMEEATKLCDKVALLNNGVIEEMGTPSELSLKYNQHRKYKILLKNGSEMELPQSNETAKQIFEWMTNNDLETIHSDEPDLEDIFLQVTGRELI